MKTQAFVGPMNSGYVRLHLGEKEDVDLDVRLEVLNRYLPEPPQEGEIIEITLSDENQVIDARPLPEVTKKRHKETLEIHNRLVYGYNKVDEDV